MRLCPSIRRKRFWYAHAFALLAAVPLVPCRAFPAQVPDSAALRQGRELLAEQQFAEAETVFREYLRTHPGAAQAQLGLGAAELGQHHYEQAESTLRALTAQEPQLWQAHKNLVVVEAALGRWEEFDRERTVLRMARERGAPGISARESDVIDSFSAAGGRWVVRAYFQPVGRSEARYNFERFSPEGRLLVYVSLEDAAAAKAALQPGDVQIGATGTDQKREPGRAGLALNWYTGSAHGRIRGYAEEPAYRLLRQEVVRWARAHPEAGHTAAAGTVQGSDHAADNRRP